jgi:methionyl-tRNA synthetase
VARTNADLANDLGNLLKRTTDMTVKFLGGAAKHSGGDRTGMRAVAVEGVAAATTAYRELDLSGALTATWGIVRRANQVIEEHRPWALAKQPDERDRLTDVLAELLESLRIVAVLAEPAIPGSARAIHEALGLGPDLVDWDTSAVWRPKSSWSVRSGEPLFPRIDRIPEAANADGPTTPTPSPESGSTAASRPASVPTPAQTSGSIGIDDFRRVELVVATILEAERVDGADRLLRLQLDVGSERRQVVSGIAEHFELEQLIGRQVVLVANLEPATIRGVESRGMILAAKVGKTLTLLGPDDTGWVGWALAQWAA